MTAPASARPAGHVRGRRPAIILLVLAALIAGAVQLFGVTAGAAAAAVGGTAAAGYGVHRYRKARKARARTFRFSHTRTARTARFRPPRGPRGAGRMRLPGHRPGSGPRGGGSRRSRLAGLRGRVAARRPGGFRTAGRGLPGTGGRRLPGTGRKTGPGGKGRRGAGLAGRGSRPGRPGTGRRPGGPAAGRGFKLGPRLSPRRRAGTATRPGTAGPRPGLGTRIRRGIRRHIPGRRNGRWGFPGRTPNRRPPATQGRQRQHLPTVRLRRAMRRVLRKADPRTRRRLGQAATTLTPQPRPLSRRTRVARRLRALIPARVRARQATARVKRQLGGLDTRRRARVGRALRARRQAFTGWRARRKAARVRTRRLAPGLRQRARRRVTAAAQAARRWQARRRAQMWPAIPDPPPVPLVPAPMPKFRAPTPAPRPPTRAPADPFHPTPTGGPVSDIADAIGAQIGSFHPEQPGDIPRLAARVDSVAEAMTRSLRQVSANLNGQPVADSFLHWLDEKATTYNTLDDGATMQAHKDGHRIWDYGTPAPVTDVAEAIENEIGRFMPEQPGDMDKLVASIDSVDQAMASALPAARANLDGHPVADVFRNRLDEKGQAYSTMAGDYNATAAHRAGHKIWTG